MVTSLNGLWGLVPGTWKNGPTDDNDAPTSDWYLEPLAKLLGLAAWRSPQFSW